ncbi:MAG: hypothetical protein ACKOWO_00520 [Sediminibacterium sp.]
MGKYRIEKIFNKAIPIQALNKAIKYINRMAEKELINPIKAMENGNNKKKNLRSFAFLNFTHTSIKAMMAKTEKEKYKLENTDIVMLSKLSD